MVQLQRVPSNLVVFLPGDPPDVALEIGKKVANYVMQRFGKEITYKVVDKEEFIEMTGAPKRVREEFGERHLLAIEAIPEESWDTDAARSFLEMIGQTAWQFANQMFGDDGEGEEWKLA